MLGTEVAERAILTLSAAGPVFDLFHQGQSCLMIKCNSLSKLFWGSYCLVLFSLSE